MKIKRSWLLPIVLWAYFITAYILYAYSNMAWVNTFDLLLGLVLTLAFSVWYVVDRFRYRDPSKPEQQAGMLIRMGTCAGGAPIRQPHNLPAVKPKPAH